MADDLDPKKKPEDDEPEAKEPEESDSLDFGDDDLDADLPDLDAPEPEAAPEVPELDSGVMEIASKLAEDFSAMGIVFEPSDDPKSLLEHVHTALKSHLATKALEDKPDEGDPNNPTDPNNPAAGSPQMPQAEQTQYMQMSRTLKTTQEQLAKAHVELAARREADLIADVDALAKCDMIDDETANRWKEKFAAKRMSLAKDTDQDLRSIVSTINVMKDQAKRKKLLDPLLMSRTAHLAERPPGLWGPEESAKADEEIAERYTTRRKQAA